MSERSTIRDPADVLTMCAQRDDFRRRWADAESKLADCDSDLQTLQAELAALRKRIEDAPVTRLAWMDSSWAGAFAKPSNDLAALVRKRVALVLKEDE